MTSRRSPGRIARVGYAVLLLAQAAGQLASWNGFVEILDGYDVGPGVVWAVVILTAELVGGVGLLLPYRRARVAGAIGGLVNAVVWAFLATQAFARGLVLDSCGCFGTYLGQPLRWWVLPQEAYVLVLAVVVARRVIRPPDRGTGNADTLDRSTSPDSNALPPS